MRASRSLVTSTKAASSTVPVALRTTMNSWGGSGPRRRSTRSVSACSDSALETTASSAVSTSPMSKARLPATATSASQAAMTYHR